MGKPVLDGVATSTVGYGVVLFGTSWRAACRSPRHLGITLPRGITPKVPGRLISHLLIAMRGAAPAWRVARRQQTSQSAPPTPSTRVVPFAHDPIVDPGVSSTE